MGALGTAWGCSDPRVTHAEPEAALSAEELRDPETCRSCHSDHYREWAGSMHAYASRDPVFSAMNRRGQEETAGALGDFCVRCHAPVALEQGLTFDGLNLDEVPAAAQGVTCYFCHSIANVTGTHDAAVELASDGRMRGGIADPLPNAAHASMYSPLHDSARPESSALCGACHDIVTPAGVAIERTYLEWQASIFSGGPAATSCGACHLPATSGLAATGAPRSRLVHAHGMPGVDLALSPFPTGAPREEQDAAALAQRALVEELLDGSLALEICVQRLPGPASAVYLTLDNVAAGHGWPSGSAQDRRAWAEVVATDAEGAVLYQSGSVPDGEPVVGHDADLWLFRDELLGAKDEPVHMFWDAAAYRSHTIGAPQTLDPTDPAYYRAHVTRRFPRSLTETIPGVPERVSVRVRMRPVGLDVLDDLVQSGHLDLEVRHKMQTLTLLPNRHLASHPELSRLAEVTFEWSALTREHSAFSTRLLHDAAFPKECVSATPPRR